MKLGAIQIDTRCKKCGDEIPAGHLIAHRKNQMLGICPVCRISRAIDLPNVRKRLLYLDQSFLSDAFEEDESGATGKLFLRIRQLRDQQKLAVVVSEVHAVETANIPTSRQSKRIELWRFLNQLADGNIADIQSMLVSQLSRHLSNPGAQPTFPLKDVGLDNVHDLRLGVSVISANAWQISFAADIARQQERLNEIYREILNTQAAQLPPKPSFDDCLRLVQQLWQSELLDGVEAFLQMKQYQSELTQALDAADKGGPLKLPAQPLANSGFASFVRDVLKEAGDEGLAEVWKASLKAGQDWRSPAFEIGTAIEAASLQRWKCGQAPESEKTFHKSYGVSRQQDVKHAQFIPYMDAITVDDSMRALCGVPGVRSVLGAYPCKVFSKSNWADLEAWVAEVEASELRFGGD